MNILWITNTIFPQLSEHLGLDQTVVGGWMYSLGNRISEDKKTNLHIATVYTGNTVQSITLGKITFHLLPSGPKRKYDPLLEGHWKSLYEEIRPDVIHIHGSEYQHGLACVNAITDKSRFVISIQGIIHVYAQYFLGSISSYEVIRNITFRDIIKSDNLFQGKRKFIKRGKQELKYFTSINHVIGRTSWDYAHSRILNPESNYHFCNECLRDSFYTASKWDWDEKHPHSIFISQAAYPIKGLHQVLKAVALIKDDFPEISIRVAGPQITKISGKFGTLKLDGYAKYLLRLIKKYDLKKHIEFVGMLDENAMIEEFRNCHTFICPSSIENSPNSVGEAQLLGVPVIASYVGGTSDMVQHNETGLLYRFEEVAMLAIFIKEIFTNKDLAQKLSENAIATASERHDRSIITQTTLSIYKSMSGIPINEI